MGTTHNHDVPVAGAASLNDTLDVISAATSRGADLTLAKVLSALSEVVDVTAAAVTLDRATHGNRVVTLNRAAGVAVTIPDATGTGAKYTIINGTTVTSNTTTIKVPDASNIMTGTAVALQDGGDTVVGFETAADTDTITWNGSTTGGIKGDSIELIDIAADLWFVRVVQSATGTEATPFNATVS